MCRYMYLGFQRINQNTTTELLLLRSIFIFPAHRFPLSAITLNSENPGSVPHATVSIQNQLNCQWKIMGKVITVLPVCQCQIRVDGSSRITLRNYHFLKKVGIYNYVHSAPHQVHCPEPMQQLNMPSVLPSHDIKNSLGSVQIIPI